MMEKENLTHPIDEDLERRNRNWDKIDELKENLEEEVGELRDDLAEHKLDYIEYLDSELGEEHIIRTLPNGVKDEIRVSEKKFIKKVDEITLQSNQTYEIMNLVDQPNVTIARLDIADLMTPATNEMVNVSNKTPIPFTAQLPLDAVGKYSIITNTNRIYFYLPRGTTLVQAQTALAGTTLTYQLAEPEIIDLPEAMSPNTREIVRLSEQVDKLTSAIIALGGTIV